MSDSHLKELTTVGFGCESKRVVKKMGCVKQRLRELWSARLTILLACHRGRASLVSFRDRGGPTGTTNTCPSWQVNTRPNDLRFELRAPIPRRTEPPRESLLLSARLREHVSASAISTLRLSRPETGMWAPLRDGFHDLDFPELFGILHEPIADLTL